MARSLRGKKKRVVGLVRGGKKKGRGEESWYFLPYFASFVLSRGYEHKTLSCMCELAGDDPGSAEGNGKAPVDWDGTRLLQT